MRSRGTLRVTSFVLIFPLILLAFSLLVIFVVSATKQIRRWYEALFSSHHAYTVSRTATAALAFTAAGSSDAEPFRFDASNAIAAGPVVATAAAHAAHTSSSWSFRAFLKFLNVTPLGFSLSSTIVLLAVIAIMFLALRLTHHKRSAKSAFDTCMERLTEIRFPGSFYINAKKIPTFSWFSSDATHSSAREAKRRRNTNDLLASSSSALSPASLPTHTRFHKKVSNSRFKIQGQTRPRSRSSASTGHGHASPHKHEVVTSALSRGATVSEMETAAVEQELGVEADGQQQEVVGAPNRTSIMIQVTDTNVPAAFSRILSIPANHASRKHDHNNHGSDNEGAQSDDSSGPALTPPVSLLNAGDKGTEPDPEPESTAHVAGAVVTADDSNDEGKFVAAGDRRRKKRTRGNAKARAQQQHQLETETTPMQSTPSSQPQPQSHSIHKQQHINQRRHTPAAEVTHQALAPALDVALQQQNLNPMNIPNDPIAQHNHNTKRQHRHSFPGRLPQQHQPQQSHDNVPKRSSMLVIPTIGLPTEEPTPHHPAKPAASASHSPNGDTMPTIASSNNSPWAVQQPPRSVTYAHITAHHHQQQPVAGPHLRAPQSSLSLSAESCPTPTRTHHAPTAGAVSPAILSVPAPVQSQWYSPFSTGLNIDLVPASHPSTMKSAADHHYEYSSGLLGRTKIALDDEERGAVPAPAATWGLFATPVDDSLTYRRSTAGTVGAERRVVGMVGTTDEEKGQFSFFDRALSFSPKTA